MTCPQCEKYGKGEGALVPVGNGEEIVYVCAVCGWNKDKLRKAKKGAKK